uniref:Ig-like domain-containing protein n=1 Tax=Oryzias latipes TaxID=8090 RepID=A0A3P9MHU7_ORYLA
MTTVGKETKSVSREDLSPLHVAVEHNGQPKNMMFRVRLPQTVEAVTGSCLTIPCSFEIKSEYEKHLNNKCEAEWQSKTEVKENQRTNLKLTTTKDMMGDLTKKNCTSTFKNINPKHSDQYHFRLDCGHPLQYTYKNTLLTIVVKDVPPSPTLTPPAQEVKEGTSVSLTCSAPASCLLHPPSLTWTPKLAHSQETLKENQDQTKVQISVLNFTASHLHHGKRITCTAVYWKHGGSNLSVNASLKAKVKYTRVSVSPSGPAPENRSLSLTCSSDARPPVQNYSWYRDDGASQTSCSVSGGYVFTFNCIQILTDDFPLSNNFLMQAMAEENIYDNTSELGEEDAAHPLNDSQQISDNSPSSAATEGPSVIPGKDQEDVTYSSVIFKTKRNSKAGRKYGDVSTCETEERFVVEDIGQNFVQNAIEMGLVYAEVQFKSKTDKMA